MLGPVNIVEHGITVADKSYKTKHGLLNARWYTSHLKVEIKG